MTTEPVKSWAEEAERERTRLARQRERKMAQAEKWRIAIFLGGIGSMAALWLMGIDTTAGGSLLALLLFFLVVYVVYSQPEDLI